MSAPKSPVVLVHGAWHGAWAWDSVRNALEKSGYIVNAIDLPGRTRGPGRDDLQGHASYLREYLANFDTPPLVVAHSYGGAVVTEAMLPSIHVSRILMVAAFMLEEGENCIAVNDSSSGHSESGDDAFDWIDNYAVMPPDAAAVAFYSDVPAHLAAEATGRLNAENRDTIYQPVTHTGWRGFPTSYVQCTRDKAILPGLQAAMASRADTCYRMDTGHSPMLADPETLTAIIAAESHRLR